jgi:crossover junction endodeoxyribonuclease RuvC
VIVVGIDPGTRKLGWGVVRRKGTHLEHVAHGVIALDERQPLAQRLATLSVELTRVLQEYCPQVGSVETLFFHKDAQAAAKLGHARGVVLLCLAQAGIEVAEYQPARVKRAITGNGQAEKRQVAMIIRAVLGLPEVPPPDAADALALAVTHLRIGPLMEALAQQLEGRPVTPARRRPSRRPKSEVGRLIRGALPKRGL